MCVSHSEKQVQDHRSGRLLVWGWQPVTPQTVPASLNCSSQIPFLSLFLKVK